MNTKQNPYEQECMNTLNRLWQENRHLKSMAFFLDTVFHWSENLTVQDNPDVVILGSDVPEELVIAAGAMPYWLLGGSFASVAWSDDLVPRDADPVSRSILGYIHQPDGTDFTESLFIIPLTGDNMRKIAYELKAEGKKVFLLDAPPEKSGYRALEKRLRQNCSMMEAVSEHMGTKVTAKDVKEASRLVGLARRALASFTDLAGNIPDIITPAAVRLVQNSYYCTDSLEYWTMQIVLLSREIKSRAKGTGFQQHRPGVLLMGSPIFYPNLKIPFLLQDVGLDIIETIDSSSLKFRQKAEKKRFFCSRNRMIRNISEEQYQKSGSSFFVENTALRRYVRELLSTSAIDGVVYHILKGQIEQDFELSFFEELFAAHNIPVFRLETDYSYQDIEQLRIRTEAFAEMLSESRKKEMRIAL